MTSFHSPLSHSLLLPLVLLPKPYSRRTKHTAPDRINNPRPTNQLHITPLQTIPRLGVLHPLTFTTSNTRLSLKASISLPLIYDNPLHLRIWLPSPHHANSVFQHEQPKRATTAPTPYNHHHMPPVLQPSLLHFPSATRRRSLVTQPSIPSPPLRPSHHLHPAPPFL